MLFFKLTFCGWTILLFFFDEHEMNFNYRTMNLPTNQVGKKKSRKHFLIEIKFSVINSKKIEK